MQNDMLVLVKNLQLLCFNITKNDGSLYHQAVDEKLEVKLVKARAWN